MERTMCLDGKFYSINIPGNVSDGLADLLTQSIKGFVKTGCKLYRLESELTDLDEKAQTIEKYIESHQDMHPEVKAQVDSEYNALLSRHDSVMAEYDGASAQKELEEARVRVFCELSGLKRKQSLRERIQNGVKSAYKTLKNILW